LTIGSLKNPSSKNLLHPNHLTWMATAAQNSNGDAIPVLQVGFSLHFKEADVFHLSRRRTLILLIGF
jgi:hypothetical protein